MTPVYVVCLVLAAAPALSNAPNVLEEHRDVQQSITYSRYGHTVRLDTLPPGTRSSRPSRAKTPSPAEA
ncbi:hypothetical protein OG873_11065 [Streptomyces violaceus]|uniref:Secreted protein n=1 Tax=Streptomyces violaceus TaxID=1936 RepID=A0ABZ1NRD4_STRVL